MRTHPRVMATILTVLLALVFSAFTLKGADTGLRAVHSSTDIASVPTTINDFFLPGSQPNESGNFEMPDKCDNCHGGYDIAVEPAFSWRGSMMSQAARDPLFYACLTIANQDVREVVTCVSAVIRRVAG